MPFVSIARRPSGQYSLIKVTALGIAAPSPRPVTERHITSWVRLPENADARQATPKISTEPIRTALRPRRSASGPAERAPNANPNSAALKTGPSAGRSTPHSVINDGAMYPMAAVSNPSSRTMQKQSAKISHWKLENGCSLRNVWMSMLRATGMISSPQQCNEL